MNIIALSLGLAPIPPLPPAVRARQNRIADDRHKCVNTGRMTRIAATAYRTQIADMVRDTGPGTTQAIADAFGTTSRAVRLHLARLERDGRLRCEVRQRGSQIIHVWHATERGDA